MRRFLLTIVAMALAFVLQPTIVHADGSAPIRVRNSSGSAGYVCADNTGRGGPNDKSMKDGRPGALVAPGATIRIPNTNQADNVTLRWYNADGVEVYSKTILLLPIGGEKWEQEWDGSKLRPDNR
jgi:hypothetical protein